MCPPGPLLVSMGFCDYFVLLHVPYKIIEILHYVLCILTFCRLSDKSVVKSVAVASATLAWSFPNVLT